MPDTALPGTAPVSPVFIVGSPRSGTSILIASLLRAGYSGFLEGNFLSLLQVIERDVERHFGIFYTPNEKVLTSRLDRAALKERLSRVIVEAAVAQQPAGPWVDKTGGPEMIQSIPVLRRLLPGSRFIFAKRRAIENVVSRLIKFPTMSFEYHCADWARTMAAWRALRTAAPGPDLMEVDQRAISQNSADVAARLGTFLGLAAPGVAQIQAAFTRQKPQQTEEGSADRVLSLDGVGWTEAQRAAFHAQCDGEMAAEGYSTDETYWTQAARLAPP